MPLYEQGDTYEEEESTEQTQEQEAPAEQQTKKVVSPKILVGVGIGVIALTGVIFSVAMVTRKAHDKKLEDEQFEQVKAVYESDKQMQEQETEPVSSVMYSDKELHALRKWGYTASEIQKASDDGLSAKSLVESARADREEAQKEALAAVSDTASDEYKQLLAQTWLGGEPLDISGFDTSIVYEYNTHTEIVDYDRVEPRGEQCFVKCYLDDGNAAFMPVKPDRFNSLADHGNMVVDITDCEVNGVKVIVEIAEQRVN